MNTLLVPTDFSPAAENATAYAAQLARQINASIVLLHVYQLPVPMTDYPVLMVTNEDLKKVSDEGLQRAMEKVEAAHPGVSFKYESRLGDVATEIQEASRDHHAFAIVVGTKEMTGFERFLFGDTTSSLIKHVTGPLIAVPENAKTGAPKNIALATDLLNITDVPTTSIVTITRELGAALHVVHVEQDGDGRNPDELMAAFTTIKASYHIIKEEEVATGLKHYVEQNNIDLVLLLPHEHNLYERLFFKGHTKDILEAMPVPVMSLRGGDGK